MLGIYNNLGSQVSSGWQVHAYPLDSSPDQQSQACRQQLMGIYSYESNKLGYKLKLSEDYLPSYESQKQTWLQTEDRLSCRLPCVKQKHPGLDTAVQV